MSDEVSAPPALSRTPTAVWIVTAILAAVVVFTTTLAVIEWRRANDVDHTESLRRQAASTAAQFGTALYTYDYKDLAAAKARVLSFASAAYAKGYDATSGAEKDTITKLQARQSARPSGVFLTDVVKGKVAAVVILNTALQSTAGNRTSVQYLDVALVRQGGAWKVATAQPAVNSS